MKLELHPKRPFIIAELGTSCDGSVGNMIELAKHCVAAGASAIKMQDHEYQDLAVDAQHPPWFQGPPNLESRYAYVRRQIALVPMLRKYGPECPVIVSPFSLYVVANATESPVCMPDAWKIASGQVTNHELIRACVATGLPVILSSGMTTWTETRAAVDLVPLDQMFAVLDCTSEYPTRPENVSVGWGDGLSDHTPPDSIAAAIVAMTRGARVFERHVCFDQRMYGSDAKNACTLEQFERYCRELDFAARIPYWDIRDENAARLTEMREQFLVRSE